MAIEGFLASGRTSHLVDEPTQSEIDHAVEFSCAFAETVSKVTDDDFWRLKSNLGRMSMEEMAGMVPNFCSRIFEDRICDLLRRRFDYAEVESRYRPNYLNAELDIFALKKHVKGVTKITICEYKFALENREINYDEIQKFKRTSEIVESHERKENPNGLKFEAWFVTNSTSIQEDALKLIEDGFKIKIAHLPANWASMDNWDVSNLLDLKIT